MKNVAAILVNYNGAEDTIECIESLKQILNPPDIYVVDNCSTDDSTKVLAEKSKTLSFKFIEAEKNGGFAYGNNIAIKQALYEPYDYFLLINNDTIVNNDFLERMLIGFENENVGVVMPLILYETNRNIIWSAGGEFDRHRMVGTSPWQGKNKANSPSSREIEFASGCCMLIKREVIKQVGLLPEDYFMYFEDLDYCYKIRNNGYKIWFQNDAIIYHKVSLSSGGEDSPFSVEWLTRSHMTFIRKYGNTCELGLVDNAIIRIRKLAKFARYLMTGKSTQARSVLKGLRDVK